MLKVKCFILEEERNVSGNTVFASRNMRGRARKLYQTNEASKNAKNKTFFTPLGFWCFHY